MKKFNTEIKESQEAKEKFGERLKKLREWKGQKENRKLLQCDACMEMQLGTNNLSLYEQGKRFPNLISLIKIKEYYGISYDYLFGDTENKNPDIEYQDNKNKKAINDIKNILNELDK